MDMPMSSRPVLSPSCHIETFEKYPGTFLLLDGARAHWAFVTVGGLEILGLCDGTRTEREIAQALSENHGTPTAEALETTKTFFAAMRKTGLVYGHDEVPSPIKTPQTRFKGLTIEITRECNLRCHHCYLAAGERAANELGLDEIQHVITEAQQLGATFVNLSGGEPLLREDCLPLLEYIAAAGLQSIVGTNGTLLSAEMARKLAELPVLVQLSLDGASNVTHDAVRGHGAFRRAMRGLNHLVDAGLADRVTLAFTAMAGNVHEASAPIDLALEKGLRGVIFTSLLAGGNAKKNWEDLKLSSEQALQLWEFISIQDRELAGRLRILHQGLYLSLDEPGVSKVLCSIGTNLRIDPEGNVYPCQCFVGGKDYRLGNIREQPLREMVLGSHLQQIKAYRYERIEIIEQCRACSWRHYCGAGCMGHAYHKEGTILARPDCDLRRSWTRRLFELNLAHCLELAPAQEAETG